VNATAAAAAAAAAAAPAAVMYAQHHSAHRITCPHTPHPTGAVYYKAFQLPVPIPRS